MTGYDLKTRHFDKSVAHFWPADQAQIYRTLDRIVERGWAEARVEIQYDRPNRKVYEVTEEGRAELERWLKTPQPPPSFREPLLVQIFFAAGLENEKIAALLERSLDEHRELLARYKVIPLPPLDDAGASREEQLRRLTLELGLEKERAYVRWLEGSIARVRNLHR